jgi:chromosome partitioning protein
MAIVIALANQKGGVGKTTSTITLGAALQKEGEKVLLVDLDPQASLTDYMGYTADEIEPTIYNVLLEKEPALNVILKGNPDLLPSNIDLSQAEVLLMGKLEREHVLRKALTSIRENYNFILIDCPPSLGILNYNAMVAAQYIIVPVMTDYLSMRGIKLLLETVESVKEGPNPELKIMGILPTFHEPKTVHCKQVLETIHQSFSDRFKVFDPINKSVKFKEAPVSGHSILTYFPQAPGAEVYQKIAREVISYVQ